MLQLYYFHWTNQNDQQQEVCFYMQPVSMHNEGDLFLKSTLFRCLRVNLYWWQKFVTCNGDPKLFELNSSKYDLQPVSLSWLKQRKRVSFLSGHSKDEQVPYRNEKLKKSHTKSKFGINFSIGNPTLGHPFALVHIQTLCWSEFRKKFPSVAMRNIYLKSSVDFHKLTWYCSSHPPMISCSPL